MTNECRCGRPTKDAAYVCDQCADDLARALGEIPWLTEQLDITASRQQGIDYRSAGSGKGAKKPAEMPLPVHWGASEARTHLNDLLVSWVTFCTTDKVRNSDHHDGAPNHNLVAMSRWLLWRVDGLTLLEIGLDAVEEITTAVTRCRRVIDRNPELRYLGDCSNCDGGDLYTLPGSAWATCRNCDTRTDADQIRANLLAKLDDRLCTAAEIAHLSTFLGLKATRDQVRNRINQWAARGVIKRSAAFSDQPTYKFGDIYDRLIGAEYGTSRPTKDVG